MTQEALIIISLLLPLTLGVASGAISSLSTQRYVVAGATCISALVALVASITTLWHNDTTRIATPPLPLIGNIALSLDALSAVFVLTLSVVAIFSAIYFIGYGSHGSPTRVTTATFPLFFASLLFVALADTAATFLLAWELMAVTSLVLVLTESTHQAARDAASWYGALTHMGFLCIAIGLALVCNGDFTMPLHDLTISSHRPLTAIAFVLLIVGFASKAGIVPLHVWLPRAHVEAPSHISALMSGAMVNLGVYGLLRMSWVPSINAGTSLPSWWWQSLVILGVISAVYGILQAMMAHDLKRLLAYSTSENIGLIFIAIGIAGGYAASGNETLATVALVAALLHTVNHGVFKSLLFLGVGNVVVATGTRDLNALGGLVHTMPITAGTFAVGSFAICALPPLNGFASEWLLLQSLVHGIPTQELALRIAIPIALGAMALAGGLAAATFVKAFGTGFLALSRSPQAQSAREGHPFTLTALLGLAAMCFALGVGSAGMISLLTEASHSLASSRSSAIPPIVASDGLWLRIPGAPTSLSPAFLFVLLVAITFLVVIALRLLRSSRSVRVAPAWGCGRQLHTSRMEYTATAFAEPLQRIFDDVVRPETDVDVSHQVESRYYLRSLEYHHRISDIWEPRLFAPIIRLFQRVGHLAASMQNGNIHRYLAYGFVALLVVLAATR